jgi:iron complex outermembrane receptor protein
MTTEYQLLKSTHLWVRGENLLAQHYEVIDGFPMPKATFMGGVSFTF